MQRSGGIRHGFAGLLVAGAACLFAQPPITQFTQGLPPDSSPTSIALGPDGACWFVEQQANRVGRITPAGAVSEYAVPASPLGIATGPDGALWFTEAGGKIGRMTISGVVTNEFLAVGSPSIIVLGPDGWLWFLDNLQHRVGRMNQTGSVASFPLPGIGSLLAGIAPGPDGALWFTDSGRNEIGRVTTTGSFSFYPIPTAMARPGAIANGPDGALWFTEPGAGKIGRIDATPVLFAAEPNLFGTIKEFALSGFPAQPEGIVLGPDGALWFGDSGGLGRIDTAGSVTEDPLPAPGQPDSLVVGPDGALWFTAGGGQIARATVAGDQPFLVSFPIPWTSGCLFENLARGPDNAMWLVGSGSGCIGRLSPSGSLTLGYTSRSPTNIAVGSDGALWFTQLYANMVGRITTDGQVSEYRLPDSVNHAPLSIAAGPDGSLWFGEASGTVLGRITTAGAITEYPLQGAFANGGITVGPDGDLWFALRLADGPDGAIGRMTVAGVLTTYPIPTPNMLAAAIVTGPDGAMWFTDLQYDGINGNVGRITSDGAITEYPLPTKNTYPRSIVPAPDGALWFIEGASIGRITTSGTFTEFPLPETLRPESMALGPDGALWMVADLQILRFTPPRANLDTATAFFATNPPGLPVTIDGANYTTPQTFTWAVGSLHQISVPGTIPGAQFSFTSWNDGGTQVHTVAAIPVDAVYVANLKARFQLAASASLPATAPVTLTPASFDGYYQAGTAVQLTAPPAPAGYQFAGWVGTVTSPNNPLTLTMNAPAIETALYTGGICSFSLSQSSASVAASGGAGEIDVNTGPACIWTASSSAPWLTITSAASGVGSGSITYVAAPGTGRQAVLTIAGIAFPITQGLSPFGVMPASGSGTAASFTALFSDPAGYADLDTVYLFLGSGLDSHQPCYLEYSRPLDVLYLVNDTGAALLKAPAANSRCSVESFHAAGSGSLLTLTLSLSFRAAFAGNQIVYLAATDQSGNNSGWQATGVWAVPGTPSSGPSVGGVSPVTTNAANQTFAFTFSDSNGVQDLGVVDVLIGSSLLSNQVCYLGYDRPSNVLYLVGAASGLVLNGSGGALTDGRCTVYGLGSSAVQQGNLLALTLNLGFSAGFSGNQVIYMAARSTGDRQNTGWQAAGVVTVPQGPLTSPPDTASAPSIPSTPAPSPPRTSPTPRSADTIWRSFPPIRAHSPSACRRPRKRRANAALTNAVG